MGRHAVELQFQMLASVGRIELEMPAIPSEPAFAEALGKIGVLVDRRFGGPIVRKVDLAPSRVVVGLRRSASGRSRFGVLVRGLVSYNFGKRDVPAMEEPAAVEGKSFALRLRGRNRGLH